MINDQEKILKLQKVIHSLEEASSLAVQAIAREYRLPLKPSQPSSHPWKENTDEIVIRHSAEDYISALDRPVIKEKIIRLERELKVLQQKLNS